MRVPLTILAIIFVSATMSAQGLLGSYEGREDDEDEVWREIHERESRIASHIKKLNDETDRNIRSINEYFSNLKFPEKEKQSTQPTSGIQFSLDPPRQSSTKSSQAQTKTYRKAQREAEHRQWLAERQEMREAQRRRAREREMRRREREALERQRVYDQTYNMAYAHAGIRAQQLTENAQWRTGEGAILLDRTHSAAQLMNTQSESNFGQGNAFAGRHRIKRLKPRLELSSNAIPWGTMKKSAVPYEQYYRIALTSDTMRRYAPEPLTRIKIEERTGWDDLERNMDSTRFNMLKAIVYVSNSGVFPSLVYDPSSDKYIFSTNDPHKLMTVSRDGSRFDVLTLKEKSDTSFAEIQKNLKDMTLIASGRFLSTGGNIKIKPFENGGHLGSIGISADDTTVELDAENISVGYKKAKINLNAKDNELFSYSDKKIFKNPIEIDSVKFDKPNTTKEELLSAEISASLKLFERSSKVTHQSYSLMSAPIAGDMAVGKEWSLKGGADVGLSAKGKLSLTPKESIAEYESTAKLTFAEGDFSGMVVHKVPYIDGYAFSSVGGGMKLGYEYTLSASTQESSKSRNIGNLPISVNWNAKIFRYVSIADINRAYNEAKKR